MHRLIAPGKDLASSVQTAGNAAALLARAPRLAEAAEDIVRTFVKSLQKMATAPGSVAGHVQEMAMRPTRQVVESHAKSAVAASITCGAESETMLASFDGLFVHALIDLLCGAGRHNGPPHVLRDATAIDHQFAQVAFALIASAIETAGAAFGLGPSRANKLDAVAIDVLGPRVVEVGCVEIVVQVLGIKGSAQLVLTPKMLSRFTSEEGDDPVSSNYDGRWIDAFQKEIGQAEVRLDAFLDGHSLDLAALANLAVGQILPLPAEARLHASLIAQGQTFFTGEIGQVDDLYSLRIDDIVCDTTSLTRSSKASFLTRDLPRA